MDNLFDTVLEDDSSRELALLVKNLAIKWQNGDVNAAYEYISSLPCKNNILTIYPGHQSSVFQKVFIFCRFFFLLKTAYLKHLVWKNLTCKVFKIFVSCFK